MTLKELVTARDKQIHFVWGIAVLIYATIGVHLWVLVGWGPGIAWFGTVRAGSVELYQKVRKEGTPDLWDGIVMAVPSWVALAVWAVMRWL